MKKFFMLTMILMAITCSATQVPIETARITASNFYLERVNLHSHHERVMITGEFTVKNGDKPLYYIFNMDNEGFIIIAADDGSYPVLGYSFEGIYRSDSKCPAFNFWMNNYREQIVEIQDKQHRADKKISEAWDEYSNEKTVRNSKQIKEVTPLLKFKWGQSYPYNTYCPYDTRCGDTNFLLLDSVSVNMHNHVATGCVATAMGMIMSYWRYPQHGIGVHSYTTPEYGTLTVNCQNTYYDWSGITEFPIVENDPVALLLYHCGVTLSTEYGYTGSGAYYSNVQEALESHFDYDPEAINQLRVPNYTIWLQRLTSDLDKGWPIHYGGEGPAGGHGWVCDGYQGEDFFHMNWGWEGLYNGYYYLDNLNPYNTNFNQNQNATLHIHPKFSQYPYVTNGYTALLINHYGSVEDGSGPVANYEAGADRSWLIAPDDSIATLTLKFTRFNLHQSDTLKIYDGENAGAPLIGSYTGAALPEDITAGNGKLFLKFTSDAALAANGFLIEYSSEENSFCGDTTFISSGEGIVEDGSGRFMYRNGSTCVWKFDNQNIELIKLKFLQINTESGRDTINIYSVRDNELLASYSGSYMNLPDTLTVYGQGLRIEFKTDSAFRKAGWKAYYKIIISVGTKDHESLKLKIYPNPAKGYCMIENAGIASGEIELTLNGIDGKTLSTKCLSKQVEYIDLSNHKPGLYLLKLQTEDKVITRKIVIN